MRKDFELRFEQEAKALEIFRERAGAHIVRWMFSTVSFLSSDLVRQTGAVFYAAGYDETDRPILIKHFNADLTPLTESQDFKPDGLAGENLLVEEFVVYHDDVMNISRFFRDELKEMYRIRIKDRRMLERETLIAGVYGHARWEYEGNRQKRYQALSDIDRVTLEIEYGPHGEQTFYQARRDGSRFQMGQGLPKGITAKSLKETIGDRLLALVPELVAKAGVAEPIYCVALAYDGEGNEMLPPLIGIGLESERRRWIDEHGKEARRLVWNPAEFFHYEKPHTQLNDDTLEEACDQLNDYLADRDSIAPAIKLLVEVAGKLNNVQWPETIRRAEDFVVYAVDFELGSLRKNLKASLTAEQMCALKERGLL